MALLSPADQQRLRELFAEMDTSVRLVFFTLTIGCETCVETRQILDELPALSDRIAIEEVNLVLDQDKARRYGVDRAPAIAIASAVNGSGNEAGNEAGNGDLRDSRIRFLGAPSGYEFISLVQAILLVGGRPPALTEENRRRIAAAVTKDAPLVMQVFTTPT
jgi:alkyl hydroperoxide reductase subunit AhpF